MLPDAIRDDQLPHLLLAQVVDTTKQAKKGTYKSYAGFEFIHVDQALLVDWILALA